ncbi:MAG: hypothetical protein LBH02_03360 [Methanocalculaceae archaeon]|jgi:hypothetical protein|nr:hypothetical protein [Methanocalculaceae archaeon]
MTTSLQYTVETDLCEKPEYDGDLLVHQSVDCITIPTIIIRKASAIDNDRSHIIYVIKGNFIHTTNKNRINIVLIIAAIINEKSLNVPNIYGTKKHEDIRRNITIPPNDAFYPTRHICNEEINEMFVIILYKTPSSVTTPKTPHTTASLTRTTATE